MKGWGSFLYLERLTN